MKQDDVKFPMQPAATWSRDTATLRIVCWGFLFCNVSNTRGGWIGTDKKPTNICAENKRITVKLGKRTEKALNERNIV